MIDANSLPVSTTPTNAGTHVVVSELQIAPEGASNLEAAFRERLGEVDSFPGHIGLQVWKDPRRPGRYLMVTWWESEAAFHSYMRSESHRRSHARIPSEPARPHPVRVERFSIVSM
jgi:heme-degrading monooxygenase HmoA